MTKNDTTVLCPLIDGFIDGFDCMENQSIKEVAIPEKYKQKLDWKEICKQCKWREY